MQYRREVDGLRALAVIPVVLFHAEIPGFTGGFIGVDVFFVISGYLITGILHREVQENRFSILAFYERRIRRIFPALFAMLGIVFLAGASILLPDELTALGDSLVATTLFVSNILFWRDSGYFDVDAISKPLLHTWSLAVEEQFYILFPLALWAICRWRRQWLLGSLIVAATLSFLLSAIAVFRWPEAAFYLLPTRAWELLLGSLIAVAPIFKRKDRQGSDLLAALGAAGIVAPVFLYDAAVPFPGLAALPPCFGAAAIIYAGRETLIARLLSTRLLVGIGLISYSLYLWHWPLLSLASIHLMGAVTPGARIVIVLASFACAILSWRLVEQPFRKITDRRRVLQSGVAFITAGVLVGGSVAAAEGLPARFSPDKASMLVEAMKERVRMRAEYRCALFSLPGGAGFGPCPLGQWNGTADMVVIGDSYSMAMRTVLDHTFREKNLSGLLIAAPGCPPVFAFAQIGEEDCVEKLEYVSRYIEETQPKRVLLIGSWYRVLFFRNTVYRGRLGHDAFTREENLRDAISETVDRLHGYGARVGFVLPPPGAQFDVPSGLARNRADLAWTTDEHRRRSSVLEAILSSVPIDAEVDLSDAFCDEKSCLVRDRDGPFYIDGGHVNFRGQKRLEPQVREIVDALRHLPPLVGPASVSGAANIAR